VLAEHAQVLLERPLPCLALSRRRHHATSG
jgi:hypothetical protein